MVPFSSPDRFDEALGNPHDRLQVSLPDCQHGGRGSWGDGLDLRGWEASTGWRRLRGFGFHIDGLVGHGLIAVGVVERAAVIFAEVGVLQAMGSIDLGLVVVKEVEEEVAGVFFRDELEVGWGREV